MEIPRKQIDQRHESALPNRSESGEHRNAGGALGQLRERMARPANANRLEAFRRMFSKWGSAHMRRAK